MRRCRGVKPEALTSASFCVYPHAGCLRSPLVASQRLFLALDEVTVLVIATVGPTAITVWRAALHSGSHYTMRGLGDKSYLERS